MSACAYGGSFCGDTSCPVHGNPPPAAPELQDELDGARQQALHWQMRCDEEIERREELETENLQLKAELRQYQPSDGMMYKLLGLNEAIREAAQLLAVFRDVLEPVGLHTHRAPVLGRMDAWFAHPTVVRAVTSPLAQAKVKP